MAKLNGVKTLDMVNGEITRVEYGGAVYERKGAHVKPNDLLFVTDADAIGDVIQGGFYTVDEDQEGDVYFLDEDDDLRGAELWSEDKTCLVFSKVTEEVVPATKKEIAAVKSEFEAKEAQRKLEAKWAKIGRKVNEFKIGDIVRGERSLNEEHTVTGELKNEECNGLVGVHSYNDQFRAVHAHTLELITPVEARFDR